MSISSIFRRGTKPEKDGYTKKERKKLTWQNNPRLSFITWTFYGSWWGKGPGICLSPAILLVPFFVLELNKTSAGFFAWVDIFSSYNTLLVRADFRTVNQWI